MNKHKAEQIVARARKIADLMGEICRLAEDSEESELLCEEYPFHVSLDDLSHDVIAWRDAMSEKSDVPLNPELVPLDSRARDELLAGLGVVDPEFSLRWPMNSRVRVHSAEFAEFSGRTGKVAGYDCADGLVTMIVVVFDDPVTISGYSSKQDVFYEDELVRL